MNNRKTTRGRKVIHIPFEKILFFLIKPSVPGNFSTGQEWRKYRENKNFREKVYPKSSHRIHVKEAFEDAFILADKKKFPCEVINYTVNTSRRFILA